VILPRLKACLLRNMVIFASLGLPTDVFEMESNVGFLYQFQTRATICFTEHIDSVWMEERTEVVDVILNEVLRKLKFILENGLLLPHELHGLCGERSLIILLLVNLHRTLKGLIRLLTGMESCCFVASSFHKIFQFQNWFNSLIKVGSL